MNQAPREQEPKGISYDKHRLVLLVCYAAGLRLSEATHIKLRDIDGERSMLHIRSGKGRKDRYVPISPRLLNELRRQPSWKPWIGMSTFKVHRDRELTHRK